MIDKKVVLITGGAMGQGRTHAVEFAKKGYVTGLLDMLDPEDPRFAETVAMVEAEGGEALAIKANICSTPEMEAAFAAAWDKYGRLDVVVANAGIIKPVCYGVSAVILVVGYIVSYTKSKKDAKV